MVPFVMILDLAIQLALVALLVWMFASSIRSSYGGAPFVPIGAGLVRELLAFADTRADDTLYDLGCGDGRVLISALRDLGVRKAVGYDIARFPLVIARWRLRRAGLRGRAQLFRGDARRARISDATLVYLYLYPKLTNELAGALASQMRPGTRILCPSFPIDCIAHPEYRLLKEGKVATTNVYLFERI